jgi:hypothetical protein
MFLSGLSRERLTIFCVLLLCFSSLVMAQPTLQGSNKIAGNSLSISPLFLPFGTIHLEYERAIGNTNLTVGASTWLEYRNVQDNWIHLRLLYYVTDDVFRGLAIGLTGGVHRSNSDEINELKDDTAPVGGAVIQYNWMPGREEVFLIGTGLGAEVPLANRKEGTPLPKMNGNLRVMIGFLF